MFLLPHAAEGDAPYLIAYFAPGRAPGNRPSPLGWQIWENQISRPHRLRYDLDFEDRGCAAFLSLFGTNDPVPEWQTVHPHTHYPTGQPQLTTIKLTIAPHTVLPWHTHPFPNSVHVLSGTLALRDWDSGKTLVVHQGQAVGESVDDIHRGESGDEPTVLLITYAGTPGVPTSVPAKGEKAEY